MRAVVQRVSEAIVEVDAEVVGQIGDGLLVYLGVHPDDGPADIDYIVDKVRHLRIFADAENKLNLDVGQVGGSVLVVSAFTTQADARKGRRPSFDGAASGDFADDCYRRVCDALDESGVTVARGVFGAMMNVRSINAGPICVLLDSTRTF